MPRRAPRYRGLSQYIGGNASTTKVYYVTGVDNRRKTYSGSMTVKFSDFFRRRK